jgi:hypothetical protein
LVFDFNQRAIKRGLPGKEAVGDGSFEIVTEPTTIERRNHAVFAEGISTSLPYRVKQVPIPKNENVARAVMCSEDNIILVCVRGFAFAIPS